MEHTDDSNCGSADSVALASSSAISTSASATSSSTAMDGQLAAPATTMNVGINGENISGEDRDAPHVPVHAAHDSVRDATTTSATTTTTSTKISSAIPPSLAAMKPQPTLECAIPNESTPASPASSALAADDDTQQLQRARELELFKQQLEKEMSKRRPDHFIIGVICRSLGGVPTHMRARVWQELLGVSHTHANDAQRVVLLDQSILHVEEDLENQKVISADACRTRGTDAFFRLPSTIELLTKLLTYYCKRRSVRYKQGMNEVLAPFLILDRTRPLPESVIFHCFYALIDKFLPHVFADREFKSLQCSFQLYRLLLLYHDPMLCHYLDQHDMTPELYVTPWFMTLFARSLAPSLVFKLWDFFLLEEHPFLLHYVAYALVAKHRAVILSADVAMLPQVLAGITFVSPEDVEVVCDTALALAQRTPRSFERDLYAVCYGGYSDANAPLLRHLSAASSLQVYPDELVANLLQRLSTQTQATASIDRTTDKLDPLLSPLGRSSSFSNERSASASSVFFIVLDCRPIAQYRACHLSLSYHIDPEVVGSPDALVVLLQGFARMKGCHFCFVGPSDASLVEVVGGSTSSSSSSRAGNLALDTISRLARGISGERNKPQQPPVDATVATTAMPLELPTSPGVPGTGANDLIRRELSSSGMTGGAPSNNNSASRQTIYYEHISVTRLVLMFLQKGFEHISRLDGGFDELKRAIVAMDAFTQEQLLVFAEPPSSSATAAASATSPFKLFSKIGLARLRSTTSDDNIVVVSDALVADTSSNNNSAASPPSSFSKASPPTTFSQRFQSFTTAVSQTATAAVVRARSSSELASPVGILNRSRSSSTDERELVGEAEWVEVCLRTKEALEKSLAYKDVVFQTGSMGILLQKAPTSKKFLAMVDSIVPDSQASESQQLQRGDLLVAVNGQSMERVPFVSVVALVKDATRPIVLRFQNANAKQALASFDALSIPLQAPTRVSATKFSIGITWSSQQQRTLPHVQYHLQYARQSEFHFNPWISAPMKLDTNASDHQASGITSHTNGTMVGLAPGQSFVFRVRCGINNKWGPYSLSSDPISTLELEDDNDGETVQAPVADRLVDCRAQSDAPVFLPGSCPVFIEHGVFYYKVILSLYARRRPAMDATKLELILEKGDVIQCNARRIAPGTNQIFVRLAFDDVAASGGGRGDSSNSNDDDDETLTARDVMSDADDDEEEESDGVWAFENTPEGAVVLERLSEPPLDAVKGQSPLLPLQEHAKAVVSSLFAAATNNSNHNSATAAATATTTTTSDAASDNESEDTDVVSNVAARVLVASPSVAPTILQVFPVSSTSIVVTWDPINDAGVTKYQLQSCKNRIAAMWWTVNADITAETLKFTVDDLLPNTAYLFRIRGFHDTSGWTPYSDASVSCKTLCVVQGVERSASFKSSSGGDDSSDELVGAASSAPPSRTASGTSLSSGSGSSNSFRLPVGSIFSTPVASSSMSSTASTATSNTPLRTGSTFLDKAVAAASRLTRRRSLSSSATVTDTTSAPGASINEDDAMNKSDHTVNDSISDNGAICDRTDAQHGQTIEEDGGVTLVNLSHWKHNVSGTFQDFCFFAATQYARHNNNNRATSSNSAVVAGQDLQAPSDSDTSGAAAVDPVGSSAVSHGASLDRVGERDVVVTPTSLFVLNASASTRDGFAVLEHSRMLESLVKITTHKAVANLIVLHFKNECFSEVAASGVSVDAIATTTNDGIASATGDSVARSTVAPATAATEQLYFVVSEPDACVALVRRYYEQLLS